MTPRPKNAGGRRRRAAGAKRPAARPSSGGGRNLKLAVLTGVTLAALVVGLLYVGAEAFFGLASVLILLAQAEFYRAGRNAGYNPATAVGLVGGGALLLGVFLTGGSAAGFVLFATLASCWVWYLSLQRRSGVVVNIAITMLGVVYIPLLGSFAGLLARRADGRGVTIATIGATAVFDIFAYAGGSRWGRHLMAPAISPGKTWEGALAGALATVAIAGLAGPRLGPWSAGQAALLGGVIAVLAPLGDLMESAIKRDLGIKDMGTVLPGHGGALDRVDAILFAAPAVYFSLRLFGI